MKKILSLILIIALAAGGYVLYNKSGDTMNQPGDSVDTADSSLLSVANQSISNDHIRTAIKKQTLDRTGTQKVSVDIGDFFFDPTVLKIKNGTTVTWTNSGMTGHDIRTDSASPKTGPNSELLNRGETYSFTFDEPGLYLYYCSPHPAQMRAVIEVVE